MGVLVLAGNDAAETKTTEPVSRGRYHICTDTLSHLGIFQMMSIHVALV